MMALQIRDTQDAGPLAAVGRALADRQALLVLDNAEHVAGSLPSLRQLLSVPAVALLVARAREVVPGFRLCENDALATAQICRGLDPRACARSLTRCGPARRS